MKEFLVTSIILLGGMRSFLSGWVDRRLQYLVLFLEPMG